MNMMLVTVAFMEASLYCNLSRKLIAPVYRIHPVCGLDSNVSDCKALFQHVSLRSGIDDALRELASSIVFVEFTLIQSPTRAAEPSPRKCTPRHRFSSLFLSGCSKPAASHFCCDVFHSDFCFAEFFSLSLSSSSGRVSREIVAGSGQYENAVVLMRAFFTGGSASSSLLISSPFPALGSSTLAGPGSGAGSSLFFESSGTLSGFGSGRV
jgi:hypothetical protein